jgi:DNA-binding LytR/AlgR family response regulator
MRKLPESFVKNTDPQSTLRELRDHIAKPVALVILVSASAVAALVGPFETGALLGLVPRVLYWLTIVFTTYSIGYVSAVALRRRASDRWPRPAVAALAGVVTGAGVCVVVTVANLVTFAYVPPLNEAVPLLATVFAISVIVSVAMDYVLSATTTATPDAPRAAAILDRIPYAKRGALVSISVEDHYVRIRTDKGEELVLMRLGDAIREVEGVSGAQVHRSHWVALDQVRDARREGDRAVLTMTSGPDIPVSRSNLPKMREAGLLPR